MPPHTGQPRRPDDLRRHNLGAVLAQVHRDGELTRAELTARLGLSRSTIGVLVADLAGLRLVSAQVPTGGERAGRPSHLVGPRDDGPYAFAVDVDISHVCVAAVGLGGHILARQDLPLGPEPTPGAVRTLITDAIATVAGKVAADAWPVAVGISIPGTVSDHGVIGFAPNLGWHDVPLGTLIAEDLPGQLPVVLGNDADLAVIAEHQRGAGRGCEDLVYLLGRVGVGAGIVVGGRPLVGHARRAGELGHIVLNPAGPECSCGKRGCVETYVGDTALLRAANRDGSVAEVVAAAMSGDATARAAVQATARWLGHVVANVANFVDPERVILGGSLGRMFTAAPEAVLESIGNNVFEATSNMPELCTPALGEDSALLGAAELAFAGLLADPLGSAESHTAAGPGRAALLTAMRR